MKYFDLKNYVEQFFRFFYNFDIFSLKINV